MQKPIPLIQLRLETLYLRQQILKRQHAIFAQAYRDLPRGQPRRERQRSKRSAHRWLNSL